MKAYSEVVKAGWILPRKAKYTMQDVKNAILDSLFRGNKTLTEHEAKFVCRCSAAYWDTETSKAIK